MDVVVVATEYDEDVDAVVGIAGDCEDNDPADCCCGG
jgi:hypothetical protein